MFMTGNKALLRVLLLSSRNRAGSRPNRLISPIGDFRSLIKLLTIIDFRLRHKPWKSGQKQRRKKCQKQKKALYSVTEFGPTAHALAKLSRPFRPMAMK